MVWGGGIPPECQGWLKWPTLSFQRPHPLHLTPPSIPKQFRRSSGWSQSCSEKAGAQTHDLEVWGVGPELRAHGRTGIGEHWPWRFEPSVTNSHLSRGRAMSKRGQVWGPW